MVSVVIPCYNSARYIAEHLRRLSTFLGGYFAEFEIVVVDDGSRDATAHVVRVCAHEDAHIRVITLLQNSGKGAAVKAGMLASRGAVVLFTDADLPYDLEAIPYFARALEDSCDVVLGTRDDGGSVSGQKKHRTLLSRVFARLAGLVLLYPVPDTQAGFKGFSGVAARELFKAVTISGFGFDVEVIALAQKWGMRIAHVPVLLVHQEPSTVTVGRDGLRMCLDLFRIVWRHRL